MVIYIAGPISSDLDGYKEKFCKAEERLKAEGHIVWNPAHAPVGLPYLAYFPICLAMLDTADAIYMLKGYTKSIGAVMELKYALENSKTIMLEEEL